MLLGRSQSFRVTGVTSLVIVLLAVVATLLLGFRLPASVILSDWQSHLHFRDPLRLTADRLSWILALALLIGLLAACLAGLSVRSERSGRYRANSLLVVACALVAIFADNLMTVAVSWVALDLAILFSLSHARGENQAVADFIFNLLAVTFVIAAAMVGVDAGVVPTVMSSANLSAHGILFLVIAVIFRLGLYPVRVSDARVEESYMVEMKTTTRLARLAVAFDLLVALVTQPQSSLVRVWLTGAVILAGLLGGCRWYLTDRPRDQLKQMFLAQSCVMMLIFLWGGQWAVAGVIAQGLSVLLAGTVLLLYRGSVASRRTWIFRSVPAVLMLGGMPLTIGFVGVLTLYSGLLESGIWALAIPLVVLIQALLMAGGFGLVLFPGQGPPMQAPFAKAGYRLSLIIPVVVGFLGGLAPDNLGALAGVEGIPNWGAMLTRGGATALGCSLLGGATGTALWFFKEQLYSRQESIRRLSLFSWLELRWMNAVAFNMYGGFSRVMRAIALVLEGQGGVLWALVMVTIVLLVLGG